MILFGDAFSAVSSHTYPHHVPICPNFLETSHHHPMGSAETRRGVIQKRRESQDTHQTQLRPSNVVNLLLLVRQWLG